MRRRRILTGGAILMVGAVAPLAATVSPGKTTPHPVVVRSASATQAFVPECPHFDRGADGTVGPIFCTVDNPAALRYYAAALRPLIALGADARPGRVRSVLAWEYRHGGPHGEALTGTLPIQCEVFQLASHYWRWSFSYTPQYCAPPPNT
jgi:hypothetical protein